MQLTAAHKRAIDYYYKELSSYQERKITHELAVRTAFQDLLKVYAQSANWMLIPEQTLANGKRPDATLRDTFNLPRGYWEAKDTKDDLINEIRKKINAGYPITNTIFEDTRRAFLYQGKKLVVEADLTSRKELTDVLDSFFHYAEPDIATFEHAVDDFQESIPDLAQGLLRRIKEEHAKNKSFVAAFSTFYDLCRTSLDPNMSHEIVDEMLIQHLLTERLFRTIFNNPDFTHRNVIAAEIEKVIQTLTSRAFNRSDFEKSTNRFYVAIENAARNLDDWTEKQHFLNTVYERFFQGFSIKQADTHGIVYTPQEIVDFMCASVDVVLKREFGSSLSTPGVQILDPCVGTGNFIVNLIQRISGGSLAYKYEHDLFCNEVMLLPYYIASLNIEHAYYERTGKYKPFEGVAFADTLDLAEGRQLSLFVEKNTERVEREKQAQIMVVIGNPPYNVGQKNENDNNKNHKYEVMNNRIKETYAKASQATLKSQLYDAYVKFFRWATDRLGQRDGIICFVSNNSFIDQIAFDSMRRHLLQDFTQIYHFDLHGNVRRNPKLSGTTHNVFGIQVGVGITLAIRNSKQSVRSIYYYRVPEFWSKAQKLAFLVEHKSIIEIDWLNLHPDERHNWITEGMHQEFTAFLSLGSKMTKIASEVMAKTIFKTYTTGVKTNRDDWVHDFDDRILIVRIREFIEYYNGEVSRWIRSNGSNDVDSFVNYDKIKWSRNLKRDLLNKRYAQFDPNFMRRSLYRPFSKKWLYYADLLVDELGMSGLFLPNNTTESENVLICVSGLGNNKPFQCIVTNNLPGHDLLEKTQCFPFYTYAEDGTNRRENITDWSLTQFQNKYGAPVSKWDIFHYVYAMLHHPQYRERYAENLKRDLPRLPLLATKEAFTTCVCIGKRLMDIHLHYEEAQEYPLSWLENKDVPITWRVEKMRLTPDKGALKVNDWLTLADIPQQCYYYRLGNRSALEWVIDQYQVSTDSRSGIVSDPNREDEEQYIMRLVGKIITVSVETVRLVEELAQQVKQEEWMNEVVNEPIV